MKHIILFQKIIHRADLQRNAEHAIYLFGDNVRGVGLGGQAGEMRGEPNAIGIPTLWLPGVFFSDDEYDKAVIHIDKRFKKAEESDKPIIVIPADGLGTGLAQLNTRAPRLFARVEASIQRLVKDNQ